MHEQYLQKDIFVKVESFVIELKFKKGFEKCDMHIIITLESMTIMPSIILLNPSWFQCFFISIKISQN